MDTNDQKIENENVSGNEDLVALLKGELSATEADALRQRMENDQAARNAYEQFESVLKMTDAAPVLEPSSEFRSTLKARLAEARRTGKTEESKAPASKPSLRLTQRSEPKRSPWLRYTLSAAALVLLSLTVSRVMLFPSVKNEELVRRVDFAKKRWAQRRAAPSWSKVLKGNQIELPPEISNAETLMIVAHYDLDSNEDCLVAYSEDDIQAMRDNPDITDASLNNVLARAEKVVLQGGSYAIPNRLLPRLGGSGSEITVVKLVGRVEIWSSPVYQDYLQDEPTYDLVDPKPAKKGSGKKKEAGLLPRAQLSAGSQKSV